MSLSSGLHHSRLGRALHRWLRSNDELVSEELINRAVTSGATPIGEVKDRTRVTVQGTVAILTINPQSRHTWLEADLADGSGTLVLLWMGRGNIPGVTAGRTLRVHGLVTTRQGRRVMYNPAYELVA